MHTAIVGAGAIGVSFAAALAANGENVTLVARGARLAALRDAPVTLTGKMGAFNGRVHTAEAPPADADVIAVAVKMPALSGAMETVAAAGGDAPVVTMQNGVRAEEVAADFVDPARVVGCVTMYGAEIPFDPKAAGQVEPVRVHVGSGGGLILGRPGRAADAVVHDLARRWRGTLPVRVTDTLEGVRWMKLLVNLNNALPAATGLSIQDAYARQDLARLGARMLKEGYRVAREEGVRLAPIPGHRPRDVRVLNLLPEPVAARLLSTRVQRTLGADPAYGSTYHSVVRGERSEIDLLNGEVVRCGRARRISVRANAAITRGVKRVEAEGRFWSPERLLNEVRPED